MSTLNLPVLSSEGSLAFYLQEIKKFPILSAEEEFMLAKNIKSMEIQKLRINLLLVIYD